MKCIREMPYSLLVGGTLFNPNGMTIQTNVPQYMMKAVLYLYFGAIVT
jgi:hypothetical protein